MTVITKEETTEEKAEVVAEEKANVETAKVEETAAKVSNSFVTTSKDEAAEIIVDAGTVVSADAGEGVDVSVNGNKVIVKLQTPETTYIDVDLVDSLGNAITCVVAFN